MATDYADETINPLWYYRERLISFFLTHKRNYKRTIDPIFQPSTKTTGILGCKKARFGKSMQVLENLERLGDMFLGSKKR
jgi:hypothetical protein